MPTIKIKLTTEDVQALSSNRNITIGLDKDFVASKSPKGTRQRGNSFFEYFEQVIATLRNNAQLRTSETYRTTLNQLRKFREGKDLKFGQLDARLIEEFEAYLKGNGLAMNTTSFYMRNIRAVYNRAVESELIVDAHPFRHVYTGVAKTVKRAVTPGTIKAIRNQELSPGAEAFARDMFLFSFYTRGMSFVDMAYLKKSDLRGGMLVYKRKKTGQVLQIRWEPAMQEIVDRYATADNEHLLPIVTEPGEKGRNQYRNMLCTINTSLRQIARKLHLRDPLTMYVARHSWASIAQTMNIPVEVISRGMGHTSEKTTQIYLKTLDTSTLDRANRKIIKALGEMR